MENAMFYMGQFGLILSAAFGLALIHYKAESPERPAWYYYFTVWGVSFGSALLMSRQAQLAGTSTIWQWVYGFELLFGIERMAVWWNYQYGEKSRQLPTRFITRTNGAFAFVMVSIIILTFGWAMYERVEQNGQETHQLRTEIRQAGKVALGDTAKIGLMQRKVDTLTTQLIESKRENQRLAVMLVRANVQLSNLTDILISLKRSIARLGANVERARTSSFNTPIAPLRATGPTGEIPTSKVQTPPVAPTFRRGRKTSAVQSGNEYGDEELARYY